MRMAFHTVMWRFGNIPAQYKPFLRACCLRARSASSGLTLPLHAAFYQLLKTTTISSTLNLENLVVYFVTFRLLRVARLMIAFPEMRIVMTTFANIGEAWRVVLVCRRMSPRGVGYPRGRPFPCLVVHCQGGVVGSSCFCIAHGSYVVLVVIRRVVP